MPHLTQLQSLLGLNAMSADTRAMIESIVAVAALLYALALRHRRGNLRAWPVAMVGVGLAIDIALLPLGDWYERTQSARNHYAEAHRLPLRNEPFDWSRLE